MGFPDPLGHHLKGGQLAVADGEGAGTRDAVTVAGLGGRI